MKANLLFIILSVSGLFLLIAYNEQEKKEESEKAEITKVIREKAKETGEKEISTKMPAGRPTDPPEKLTTEKKKEKGLPTDAPEVIIIENKGYKKDKKGPVEFQHIKHQEEYITAKNEKKIACTECHHVYDKKKNNTWKEGDPVKRCGSRGCHDPKKKVKKVYKLQIAYHKNCKDCHKAVVKAKLKKEDEAPYKKCMNCMSKLEKDVVIRHVIVCV